MKEEFEKEAEFWYPKSDWDQEVWVEGAQHGYDKRGEEVKELVDSKRAIEQVREIWNKTSWEYEKCNNEQIFRWGFKKALE